MRIESYISHRLEAGYINLYNEEVKRVIFIINNFFSVLA
jgi:hypothetical protein